MTPDEISELINRRRRQILIHSIIYYQMNDTLVSDNQWADWAKELTELQELYPNIAKTCVYADDFAGFDPSTGYNLPLNDLRAVSKARQLLAYRYSKGETK